MAGTLHAAIGTISLPTGVELIHPAAMLSRTEPALHNAQHPVVLHALLVFSTPEQYATHTNLFFFWFF
jgi:hypothetical protein